MLLNLGFVTIPAIFILLLGNCGLYLKSVRNVRKHLGKQIQESQIKHCHLSVYVTFTENVHKVMYHQGGVTFHENMKVFFAHADIIVPDTQHVFSF